MEIECEGIDSALHAVFGAIMKDGIDRPGTRGGIREVVGVMLRCSNPRARLSRSQNRGRVFSPLGELLWYFSHSDSLAFIHPYINRYEEEAVDGKILGAYGPRLFNMHGKYNQMLNIENMLKKNPESKRAVIQIFDAEDTGGARKEVPCTSSMQFLVRDNKLNMFVNMRSNDAYLGLVHDYFCFTMIQEYMAVKLKLDVGEYVHNVVSMHVYRDRISDVNTYLYEGIQREISMPEMIAGKIDSQIDILLDLEGRIRGGFEVDIDESGLDDYWIDIARIVHCYWIIKRGGSGWLRSIKQQGDLLKWDAYKAYFRRAIRNKQK